MPATPDPTRSSNNWTVPNLLTVMRILLTPVFVAFFLNREYALALGVFFVCGVTDALDGLLARLLNQRTPLGAMLDPLADKALLDTSFICLAAAGWLPTWLAVAVVSRDAIILSGLALLTFFGRDMRGSIAPSVLSKCTTALQMVVVLLAFTANMDDWGRWLGWTMTGAVWLTGVLTVLSGAHYVVRGFALFPSENDGPDDFGQGS